MTALDFPANPTVGQVFDRWTFDGTKWVLTGSSGGAATPTHFAGATNITFASRSGTLILPPEVVAAAPVGGTLIPAVTLSRPFLTFLNSNGYALASVSLECEPSPDQTQVGVTMQVFGTGADPGNLTASVYWTADWA